MKTEISYATAQDARAIAEIHVDSWRAAYRDLLPEPYLAALDVAELEARFRQTAEDRMSDVLLARRDGALQGWLHCGPARDPDVPTTEGEILAFCVAPAAWSSGVGQSLWLRAKDILIQRGYMTCIQWVFTQDERAIRFYRSAGFAPTPPTRRRVELGGMGCELVRYSRPIDR
jgi:ribosomal protein S18 acetylase RimI-like enzyme